jgi:hypothetical protein
MKSINFSAEFVEDPNFIHTKTILGNSTRYNCKVLNLNSLPQAKAGEEVKVFVRFTHLEVPLAQIDDWMNLCGEIADTSRYLVQFNFLSLGSLRLSSFFQFWQNCWNSDPE